MDATRLVTFVNRSARAMFERTDRFFLRRGRLSFAADAIDAVLSDFLRQDSGGAEACRSLVLRVMDPLARIDYRLLVSAIGEEEASSAYVIFIYEPRGGSRPLPATVLRDLYGLTAAEARLTNQLFVGQSLAEAAAGLGVTVNTVRSALKRIFAKCDVNSQGELLQLLALGPRTL